MLERFASGLDVGEGKVSQGSMVMAFPRMEKAGEGQLVVEEAGMRFKSTIFDTASGRHC